MSTTPQSAQQPLFFCSSPVCPGLSYRDSELAHPCSSLRDSASLSNLYDAAERAAYEQRPTLCAVHLLAALSELESDEDVDRHTDVTLACEELLGHSLDNYFAGSPKSCEVVDEPIIDDLPEEWRGEVEEGDGDDDGPDWSLAALIYLGLRRAGRSHEDSRLAARAALLGDLRARGAGVIPSLLELDALELELQEVAAAECPCCSE